MHKIAVLWDWDSVDHQTITWQDGLSAALNVLRQRGYHVEVFICGDIEREVMNPYHQIHVRKYPQFAIEQFEPDVILHFADQTKPHAKETLKLGVPMALCFTGGNLFGDNVDVWDHIFVESEVYYNAYKEAGFDNVSLAFGTNTELFKPINQPKLIDTIFPATFANWKRHNLFAEATKGLNSLAVGLIQPNDIDAGSWQDCLRHGVTVLPHTSAEVLHRLYAASKVCVITSDSTGGSQRTVLEAMSMNLPLIVTDSDKFDFAKDIYRVDPDAKQIRGAIDAILDGERETDTREWVVNNYSEFTYADSLEANLRRICDASTASV